MSDLTPWLGNLGLENYESALVSNDIDLAVVPDLTESDLEKLGLIDARLFTSRRRTDSPS